MKVKYNIKKENPKYVYNKEYEVIADYRKRNSNQNMLDNGFVVINETGETSMLLESEVIVTDNGIKNLYVFEYLS